MISTKLKLIALAGLLAAALGIGIGFQAQQTMADNPRRPQQKNAANPLVLVRGEAQFEDEGDGERERRSVSGRIKSLDLKKGTITLTIQRDGEEKRNVTYSLAGKDIKVQIRETAAKLSDLKLGVRATVFLSDSDDVTAIRAIAPPRRRGGRDGEVRRVLTAQLISVDVKKPSVTIVIRRDAGDEKKILPVTKNVRILLAEERPAKLGNLEKGKLYLFRLAENGKAVADIRPFRRGRRRPQIRGTVKSVDVKKKTITVSIRREGGDTRDITVAVSPEARISLGGDKAGQLADLKAGMRVAVQLTANRQTAVGIIVFRRVRDGDRERK